MSFLKTKNVFLINFLLLFIFEDYASASESKAYRDLKESWSYLIHGSYEQFRTQSNLYFFAVGAPLTVYSFHDDYRLTQVMQRHEKGGFYKLVSGTSIAFSFPIVPLTSYIAGRMLNNSKTIQFAKEVAAAMYLALSEAGMLSSIKIHARPREDNLSMWETKFRQDSSFPSGHIIPFTVLTMKTFQFYGPGYSLIPFALTYFVAHERLSSGRHYMSDVVAGLFLGIFSSEGVRKVAGYKLNHRAYKWLLEHDFILGVARSNQSIGPSITFTF